MTKKTSLGDLVIRTAVVRLPNTGYIIACNPQKEKADVPHAITFSWKSGVLSKGDRNYEAHTACAIAKPLTGLVDVSEQGYYSVNTKNGLTSGDILDSSHPPPANKRFGGFRAVSEIAGQAYAVGFRGMVYRLDKIKKWTCIDEGLPENFEIEAIDGFDMSDLYAIGDEGKLWCYDGKKWTNHDLPTNRNLNAVKCGGDGKVYIGGDEGILIYGIEDTWDIIEHEKTDDDIWDLEWFEGYLYLSTLHAVYRLKDKVLENVDFGADQPKTCYQLSAAKGVMWSNGEHDIMSYDGKKWSRIL